MLIDAARRNRTRFRHRCRIRLQLQLPTNSAPTEPAKSTETKAEKKVESGQRAATSKKAVEKPGSSQSPKIEPPPILPSTAHDPSRDPGRGSNQGSPRFPSPDDPRFDPLRNPRAVNRDIRRARAKCLSENFAKWNAHRDSAGRHAHHHRAQRQSASDSAGCEAQSKTKSSLKPV